MAAGSLKLASTTSAENSGLLDYLLPDFEKRYGLKVQVIAVGTGQAIKLGENGDVDLILIHDRTAEDNFVKEGFGVCRNEVMYNDFVIVGPAEDPAEIRGVRDAVTAFKKILSHRLYFISRGDNSGTHKKEMSLWKEAGLRPEGRWYLETGQGMGATLKIADEKRAYLFSDRATYLSYKDKINLTVLFEGDKRLLNPYSLIAVNPRRHPKVRYKESRLFIEWIISDNVQRMIENYKKDGQALFHSYVPSQCP